MPIPFFQAAHSQDQTPPRVALAPMEGVLDASTRALITARGGWDFCVTEFVRVSHERLPPKVFYRLCPELKQASKTPIGVPVHLQLLGSSPESLAMNALVAAKAGAQVIDLNFGCPAKIVNRHGGGARLLQEPERVYAIAQAVVQVLQPLKVPVTAKMRLGYEDMALATENAWALETAGIEQLVVHARTKTQGYRPPAYWEKIAELAEVVRLPLLANGEIWTLEDYRRCVELSGVKDVMLGRTALADPWLALQIKAEATGQPQLASRFHEVLDLIHQTYFTPPFELPEKIRLLRTKQWLRLLIPRWQEEAQTLFDRVKRSSSEVELRTLLEAAILFHSSLEPTPGLDFDSNSGFTGK